MPNIYSYDNEQTRHSDDMQDIITTVPSWLMRWGISLFFGILFLIIGFSALISYPDVIKTPLKIDSSEPPKPVSAIVSGKLVRLLVAENEMVRAGQPLAWLERVADHQRYVLNAPQGGRLSFAGIVHQNQLLGANQEIFFIMPGSNDFFGEMAIPQESMGKVKAGQQVLIKLKAYPFEEYGMIKGKIAYITDVPNKNGLFLAKVDFDLKKSKDLKGSVRIIPGMTADAEIITQDATILTRLSHSFKLF